MNGNNLLFDRTVERLMDFIIAFFIGYSHRPFFWFLFTAKDNNKIGFVLSSHSFLIVFGKRLIQPYWSTSVRWVQMRCAFILENVL